MSSELVLEQVMGYWPFEAIGTQIREFLYAAVSKENLEPKKYKKYTVPTYRDGKTCKLKNSTYGDIITLKKYVGHGGYLVSAPFKSDNAEGRGNEVIQRLYDASLHGVEQCACQLHSDVYKYMSNRRIQRRQSELVFVSAPLIPEGVFSNASNVVGYSLAEKNGWYVTVIMELERQEWETQIIVGILVGMALRAQ